MSEEERDPELALLEGILEAGVAHPVGGVVKRLERQVDQVPERGMRRARTSEVVQELDDAQLVGLLALLVRRIGEGHAPARQVVQELALEPSVFQDLPYERVEAAYRLAKAADLGGVARLFLGSALEGVLDRTERSSHNRHLDLPAGVRRSAARGRDRFVLDRLLHDQDPRVVRTLLGNPRLVERDVIKIAALRPTRPEILAEVAAHPRWSSRYRVRKALACNPHTPQPIARRLVPTLMVQDLVLALEAGVFPPELQGDVRAVIRKRRAAARATSRARRVPAAAGGAPAGGAPAGGDSEATGAAEAAEE